MIEISKAALDEVLKVLKDKGSENSIRIYVAGHGWAGPSLGLALDEAKDTDKTEEKDNVVFIMEQNLHDQMGDISIDFQKNPWGSAGFVIKPVNASNECGSCSCW